MSYRTRKSDREVTISRTEAGDGRKGRYVATIEGLQVGGEMTFTRVNDRKIILDHTGVDESLSGEGVGSMLAKYVVEDARERGEQIIPLCPFFKAQAERHEEWWDVVLNMQ